MKIILIHGQKHKGSTYHISRILLDQIHGENQIKEIFLPDVLKHFCIGCYSCIENEEKCPFYNEKQQVMAEVEAADLLIFTTPTYCMAPSAIMKTFMDLTFTCWMPHKPRKCMFNKQAVVISSAAGMGMKKAIEPISRMLFYWGVPSIQKYGVAIQAKSWHDVSLKKKQKIKKDMTRLGHMLSKYHPPKVGIKTKLLFNMMAKMQKSDMGSSLEEKKYWEAMGWLEKERPWKQR